MSGKTPDESGYNGATDTRPLRFGYDCSNGDGFSHVRDDRIADAVKAPDNEPDKFGLICGR